MIDFPSFALGAGLGGTVMLVACLIVVPRSVKKAWQDGYRYALNSQVAMNQQMQELWMNVKTIR